MPDNFKKVIVTSLNNTAIKVAPCIIKIREAKDYDAAIAAFKSCQTTKSDIAIGPNPIGPEDGFVMMSVKELIKRMIDLFKGVWSRSGLKQALTYKNFWELLCHPTFLSILFEPISKMMDDFGNIPMFLEGVIRGICSICFSGIPIDSATKFILNLYKQYKSDKNAFDYFIKEMCGSLDQFTEETAKQIFENTVGMMKQISSLLSITISVMGDSASAVKKIVDGLVGWVLQHPGQTITIAAIIAVAAALVYGTGGLGAPAIPAVAAAVLAVAATLGISGGLQQSDIERMIRDAGQSV
jgi:hypothetical protein